MCLTTDGQKVTDYIWAIDLPVWIWSVSVWEPGEQHYTGVEL